MSDETEDAAAAALRLETALERIALAMAQSMAAQQGAAAGTADEAAVKARLDALIVRLRAGLGEKRSA